MPNKTKVSYLHPPFIIRTLGEIVRYCMKRGMDIGNRKNTQIIAFAQYCVDQAWLTGEQDDFAAWLAGDAEVVYVATSQDT